MWKLIETDKQFIIAWGDDVVWSDALIRTPKRKRQIEWQRNKLIAVTTHLNCGQTLVSTLEQIAKGLTPNGEGYHTLQTKKAGRMAQDALNTYYRMHVNAQII